MSATEGAKLIFYQFDLKLPYKISAYLIIFIKLLHLELISGGGWPSRMHDWANIISKSCQMCICGRAVILLICWYVPIVYACLRKICLVPKLKSYLGVTSPMGQAGTYSSIDIQKLKCVLYRQAKGILQVLGVLRTYHTVHDLTAITTAFSFPCRYASAGCPGDHRSKRTFANMSSLTLVFQMQFSHVHRHCSRRLCQFCRHQERKKNIRAILTE